MQKISIQALARQQLKASNSTSGRAADTVFGGNEKIMRQTVIVLSCIDSCGHSFRRQWRIQNEPR